MLTRTEYEHEAMADMRKRMVGSSFLRPAIYDSPWGPLEITVRMRNGELEMSLCWMKHEMRRLPTKEVTA